MLTINAFDLMIMYYTVVVNHFLSWSKEQWKETYLEMKWWVLLFQ